MPRMLLRMTMRRPVEIDTAEWPVIGEVRKVFRRKDADPMPEIEIIVTVRMSAADYKLHRAGERDWWRAIIHARRSACPRWGKRGVESLERGTIFKASNHDEIRGPLAVVCGDILDTGPVECVEGMSSHVSDMLCEAVIQSMPAEQL